MFLVNYRTINGTTREPRPVRRIPVRTHSDNERLVIELVTSRFWQFLVFLPEISEIHQ